MGIPGEENGIHSSGKASGDGVKDIQTKSEFLGGGMGVCVFLGMVLDMDRVENHGNLAAGNWKTRVALEWPGIKWHWDSR